MNTGAEVGQRERLHARGNHGTGARWVILIYFCSGLCSLIDEVVWVRLIKLTLGNTVYASSIVVSVFMGGLALGALIMGRYADRVKKPLKLYAILELCATLSALALPLVLGLADRIYPWFFVKFQSSPAALMCIQVIFSAGIVLLPSMVMGSTLPLLGRYVTRLEDRVGRLVGRLYAVNMLGAALGCYLAGFVLIRMIGVMGTLYLAAGINLLVALGGWVLSRFHESPFKDVQQPSSADRPDPGGDHAGERRRFILMLAFFVSGLTSIGYELIWMRSIVFLLGNYTYVFSAVLTIYLLGNVIGAWIGSRLARRLSRPAAVFGLTLACLGLTGIAFFPWLKVWNILGGMLKFSMILGIYAPLFYSVFLFVAPSLLMGIGFPLGLQAWSRYRHEVGRTTATVYGINTIGAVLGGVAAGFLLIPFLGAQLSITLLGLVCIWLGCGMMLAFGNLKGMKSLFNYPAIAAGITAAALLLPSDLFENWFLHWKDKQLLAAEEDVTTTVSVYQSPKGSLTLATSGVVVAGDGREIRSAQKTLGHLGIIINGNTKEVLSIGFGSGETTACLSMHDLERIDCVEIAPELVRVALRFFGHINLGDRLHEMVNMIYMDGKNYLHLTPRTYDVIINGADIPYQPGSAPMFAKEHFMNALGHLNRGGVFITKLHLANITESSFDSILGTFLEVFPHVILWFPTTNPYFFFYLAGSRDEMLLSPAHIEKEVNRESARESLVSMNVHRSHDLFTWYIGDEGDIKKYLKDFRINSDYTPFVEFNRAEREMTGLTFFAHFIDAVRSDSVLDHMDWTGLTPRDREDWLRDHQLYYNAATNMLQAHAESHSFKKLSIVAKGLALMPENAALRDQEDRVLSKVGSALAKGLFDPNEVIQDMETLLMERPLSGAAWLIKSWAFQKKNQTMKALTAAEKSVQFAPYNAQAQDNLGVSRLKEGRVSEAVDCFREAIRLNPGDAIPHHHLGIAYSTQGLTDEAIASLRRALELDPMDAGAHCDLGGLLLKQGQRENALNHFHEALRINPRHRLARSLLMKAKAE